ncbi:Pyruvate kinase 2 [Nymphaea thermarum]|nr:Pyruvate kinase 2 [Nymphaea thermarum]
MIEGEMEFNLSPALRVAVNGSSADAILLGAETLRGLYPVQTISIVGQICAEVRAAIKVKASVIICFTSSGRAARLIAKYRPTMPVLSVFMPRLKTNQLRWSFTGAFEMKDKLGKHKRLVPNMHTKKDEEDEEEGRTKKRDKEEGTKKDKEEGTKKRDIEEEAKRDEEEEIGKDETRKEGNQMPPDGDDAVDAGRRMDRLLPVEETIVGERQSGGKGARSTRVPDRLCEK